MSKLNKAVATLARKDIGFRRTLLAALGKEYKVPPSRLAAKIASGVKVANVVKDTMDAYADSHFKASKPFRGAPDLDPGWEAAMDSRKMKFRGKTWMQPRAWQALMTQATPGGYNAFNAKRVLKWLDNLQRKSGISGQLEIQPAREYSVAAYIRGPRELLELIIQKAKRSSIDEAGWAQGKEGEEVRLWWD
jgi:hypothetical protein